MDGSSSPEPVEIELARTRNPWARPIGDPEDRAAEGREPDARIGEASVGPASASEHCAPVESITAGTPSATKTDRRRALGAVAAVAVLALSIAWAIGRSGTDPNAGDAAESLPDAAEPTTSDVVASTAAAVDEAILTDPPTAPDPTVGRITIEPARWQVASADVHPRLAELGIELVLVTPSFVVEYDTGAGERASFESRTSGYDGEVTLEAGPDWIRIDSVSDAGQSRLFEGRNPPLSDRAADCCMPYFRQPGTDRFWQGENNVDAPQRVVETDHTWTETGVQFDIPREVWVTGPDPAGGVVVSGPGGTYRVSPEGAARITTGQLIALGQHVALVMDCGADLDGCGLRLLDRAAGSTTPVPPLLPDTAPLGSDFVWTPAWTWSGGAPMTSPDGRYAPILVSGDTFQSYGVLDVTSGEFVHLADYPQGALWWAPDGRRVLFLSDGQVYLHDFDAGESFPVLPTENGVIAFAVRT